MVQVFAALADQDLYFGVVQLDRQAVSDETGYQVLEQRASTEPRC